MSTSLKPKVNDIDNIQGNPDAVITLVEYGDYQCPHCGHAYPIVKQLQKEFGDKLKLVFRNFPLRKIHPLANAAAIATEAAAKQSKFWEMHDAIFENQEYLDANSFIFFADQLGLDMDQFNNDTAEANIIQKVDDDFESGIISGVNGTPTFFINGIRYNGSWELPDLSAELTSLLN